jgi:hypothetical protein
MNSRYRLCATLSIIVTQLHAVSVLGGATTQSQVNLEPIRSAVQKAESALKTCVISSGSLVEEPVPGSNLKKIVQVAAVEGRYENIPDGRNWIKFNRLSHPWIDGPQSVAEDLITVCFNGRTGVTLYLQNGMPSQARPDGVIGERRPSLLGGVGALATGWDLSLYGVFRRNGLRLSEVLAAKDRITVATGASKLENGRFEIQCRSGTRTIKILLDPLRNYALVARSEYLKDELIERATVSDFFHPESDIYYPRAAVVEVMSHGELKQTITYKGSSFNSNPPLGTSSFEVKFPAGTRVDDQISGLSYVVSDDDEALKDGLLDQVDKIRKLQESNPAAQGSSASHLRKAVVLVTILFVASALILYLIMRRVMPRRRLGVIIVVAAVFSISSGSGRVDAGKAVPLDEIFSGHVDNCGFGATAIILYLNDRHIDLNALAKDLDLDASRSKPLSLAVIKRALEEFGLQSTERETGT